MARRGWDSAEFAGNRGPDSSRDDNSRDRRFDGDQDDRDGHNKECERRGDNRFNSRNDDDRFRGRNDDDNKSDGAPKRGEDRYNKRGGDDRYNRERGAEDRFRRGDDKNDGNRDYDGDDAGRRVDDRHRRERRSGDDSDGNDDRYDRRRDKRYSPDHNDRDRRSPGRECSRRWRDDRGSSDRTGNDADRSPDRYNNQSSFGHIGGEWFCPCGALNFKRRGTCFRQHCGNKRKNALIKPPMASLLASGSSAAQVGLHHLLPAPHQQAYTLADVPQLAAYSAQLYASTPQEKAHHLQFYTDYYTKQLASPSSESDKVNAAAAVAHSAINQLQARTTTGIVPTGTDNRMYPVPDASSYMYDASSGYYYDATTGLYYDATTQYYYNSQTAQYLYWDVSKMTYSLASTIVQQQPAQQASAAPPPGPPLPPDQPEEKKKGEKTDKVKVAKKIAKDMERWAKTLNQKKEIARLGAVAEASALAGVSSGSADIGFTVLENRAPAVVPVVEKPPPLPTLVPSYSVGSDSSGDEDEGAIDWNKLVCLICKRQFASKDILRKHQTMSDLHKKNLEKWKATQGNGDISESYRDRAAERRLKYGEDEPPPPPPVRSKNRSRVEAPVSSAPQEIGEDNVGNRLLQKMGWTAGQGLGREGQGRVGPVEARSGGLGQKRGIYTAGPGETYKDCVKKMTISRYQDLVGGLDNS